jgi:type II secretory pathway component GspD/PulD (secretin)
LLAGGIAFGSQASRLAKEARRAELAGRIPDAYLLYAEAAAMDPDNQWYWLKSQSLKSRAALISKPQPKAESAGGNAAGETPPEPHFDSPTERDLAEARKPLPPQTLAAAPGRQDFDLRGDSKALYGKVARAFGLDCVFDGDYQPSKAFAFRMSQADYREALRALEAATGSFVVPLSDKLFLVAQDTQQKRNEVEPNASVTVELSQPTTPQELTSLITAVQQAVGLQKVSWDTQRNVVVLRGSVSKLRTAQRVFEELLHPRAQVEMDVEFLEVTRSDAFTFGLNLPTSIQGFLLTAALNAMPPIPAEITHLIVFGGGKTLVGLTPLNAEIVATMSNSKASMLLHALIRSVDGQAASMHLGEKYPVITSTYVGPANFQGTGAYLPPPAFTFEDLGLTIKATPKVHGTEEITLELETSFRLLGGTGTNGIPIINSRELKSTITLKLGEWAAVSGLMETQQARTLSGIVGLSSLPVLGPLMRNISQSKDNHQVLILIRPRLLTLPPSEVVTHTYWLGSESRPLSAM